MKCSYGCDQEAIFTLKNKKPCCSHTSNKCPELRKKNAAGIKAAHKRGVMRTDQLDGKRNWNLGKHNINLLCENSTTTTETAKKIILGLGLLAYECEKCHVKDWNGEILVLELDHKNGMRSDNRLQNLRFLCPNCHSQTFSFKGRNIKKKPSLDKTKAMEAIRKNKGNIRQALLDLSLNPAGGNYKTMYRLMEQM